MTHELKTWPEYYQAVYRGDKRFELRKNDRGFKIGDFVRLVEYDPETGKCSGATMVFRIQYVLHGPAFGLQEGFCILQLSHVLDFTLAPKRL